MIINECWSETILPGFKPLPFVSLPCHFFNGDDCHLNMYFCNLFVNDMNKLLSVRFLDFDSALKTGMSFVCLFRLLLFTSANIRQEAFLNFT